MNLTAAGNHIYRNALIAAGLAAGLGAAMGATAADDAPIARAHNGSVEASVADALITARVKARMFDEDSLKESHITVTTAHGVVTLDGSVSSWHAKSVAEAAARSIDGVRNIDDRLMTPASR